MNRALILLLIAGISFSADLSKLVKEYQKKNYRYVCLQGAKEFNKLKKDPDLITMYAFSCLNIDKIDRLSVPIIFLKNSPEQRKNRAYFSLILAQKNLLTSALFDGEKFDGLSVPNSDHIISRVFNLFFNKKYKLNNNRYNMKDAFGSYTLYKEKKKGREVLVIEEKKNDGKKIIHYYR